MPQIDHRLEAQPPDEQRVFFCPRRDRQVTEAGCYDGFLDAYALDQRESACWGCPRGAARRVQYGRQEFSRCPPDLAIARMIEYCRSPARGENIEASEAALSRIEKTRAHCATDPWYEETL